MCFHLILTFKTFQRKIQVLCEVPESYEAYRKQQHRWHSGPMQLFRLCLPAIISSKVLSRVRILLFKLLAASPLRYTEEMILISFYNTDSSMEKGKFDTDFLSIKEAHPSLLFLHVVLHNSSSNHVRTRSRASSMGSLLRARLHVLTQHPSIPKIFSFYHPLPSFREHYVCHQIQCHGIWLIPAR